MKDDRRKKRGEVVMGGDSKIDPPNQKLNKNKSKENKTKKKYIYIF